MILKKDKCIKECIELLEEQVDMSKEEAENLINQYISSIDRFYKTQDIKEFDISAELKIKVNEYIKTQKVESYIIFNNKSELKDYVPKACRQYLERVFKLRRTKNSFYFINKNPYFEMITESSASSSGYGSARIILDELNSVVYQSHEIAYPIYMDDDGNKTVKFSKDDEFININATLNLADAINNIKGNVNYHSHKIKSTKRTKSLLVTWKKIYGLFNNRYLYEEILTSDVRESTRDPNILMFKNGYYLFKEQEFYSYSDDDEVFGIDYTKFNYLSKEEVEKGNELIDSCLRKTHLVKNKADLVDEVATKYEIDLHLSHHAYMLTPSNSSKRFFIWTGEPNASKSTWVNVLKKTIGLSFVSEKSLSDISEGGFKRQTLIGKILNVSSDATHGVDDLGPIKQLTGNDPINVEVKYHDDVILQPDELPCLLEVNNKIPYSDFDAAIIMRISLLHFNNSVPKHEMDESLADKLTTHDNLEYLLSLSLHRFDKEILMADTSLRDIKLSMCPEEVILEDIFRVVDNDYTNTLIKDAHKLIKEHAEDLGVSHRLEFTPTGKLKNFKNHFEKVFDCKLESGEKAAGKVYIGVGLNGKFANRVDTTWQATLF